jgi:bifunctional DNase/RNase
VRPVDVLGIDVEVASGDLIVLLQERDAPHRVLPIFVGEIEAAAIAKGIMRERGPGPEPETHDLLVDLVDCLDAHVEYVEVTEVRDNTFYAELAVDGPDGQRRVDSRPSDAIAVAARVSAPLFVDDTVLDEAGAQLVAQSDGTHVVTQLPGDDGPDHTNGPDDVDPDDEVTRFREFLDDVNPDDFDEPPGPPA